MKAGSRIRRERHPHRLSPVERWFVDNRLDRTESRGWLGLCRASAVP